MGCNMHDVFYIEISYIDSDAVCQQWANEYGVEFPTVGKDGGGNEVFDLYGIMACPTLVLIMPDRSIPIKMWSMPCSKMACSLTIARAH